MVAVVYVWIVICNIWSPGSVSWITPPVLLDHQLGAFLCGKKSASSSLQQQTERQILIIILTAVIAEFCLNNTGNKTSATCRWISSFSSCWEGNNPWRRPHRRDMHFGSQFEGKLSWQSSSQPRRQEVEREMSQGKPDLSPQ